MKRGQEAGDKDVVVVVVVEELRIMKSAWLSHGTRLLHLQKQLHDCSLGKLVELTSLLHKSKDDWIYVFRYIYKIMNYLIYITIKLHSSYPHNTYRQSLQPRHKA